MDSSNSFNASVGSSIDVNSGAKKIPKQKDFQECHCCGFDIYKNPSGKRFSALDGYRELSALAHGSFTNTLHNLIYLCNGCHHWCKKHEEVLDVCSGSGLRVPVLGTAATNLNSMPNLKENIQSVFNEHKNKNTEKFKNRFYNLKPQFEWSLLPSPLNGIVEVLAGTGDCIKGSFKVIGINRDPKEPTNVLVAELVGKRNYWISDQNMSKEYFKARVATEKKKGEISIDESTKLKKELMMKNEECARHVSKIGALFQAVSFLLACFCFVYFLRLCSSILFYFIFISVCVCV